MASSWWSLPAALHIRDRPTLQMGADAMRRGPERLPCGRNTGGMEGGGDGFRRTLHGTWQRACQHTRGQWAGRQGADTMVVPCQGLTRDRREAEQYYHILAKTVCWRGCVMSISVKGGRSLPQAFQSMDLAGLGGFLGKADAHKTQKGAERPLAHGPAGAGKPLLAIGAVLDVVQGQADNGDAEEKEEKAGHDVLLWSALAGVSAPAGGASGLIRA